MLLVSWSDERQVILKLIRSTRRLLKTVQQHFVVANDDVHLSGRAHGRAKLLVCHFFNEG